MHRQAAGIARSALGGKDVIGTRRFVAERDGRLLAKKKRAVASEPGQPPVEIAGMNFEMLGCVAVGYLRKLVARITEHDLAVVPPGSAGGIPGGRRQVVD